MVSPNPASESVTVSISSNTDDNVTNYTKQPTITKLNNESAGNIKQAVSIESIKVLDNLGKLRKTLQFPKGSRQVKVSVSDLEPGVYYLEIFDGTNYTRNILMVQR